MWANNYLLFFAIYIIIFHQKGDYMKKGLCFIENEHLFNFILTTMYFNEAKREKEIFELWRKGYNNCDIAKQVGYTEGTIRNRKKDLRERCDSLLKAQY
jgi:hypothetical protein